jgi:type IV pilus assembly protein PilE
VSNHKPQSGFTLVELMVTVAIIGVLAAIGYPSYTRYIVKANRSAAQSFMLTVASQEERFLLDARTYFCSVASGCTNVLSASTTPDFTVPWLRRTPRQLPRLTPLPPRQLGVSFRATPNARI